jgi:hypothetical protein
MLIRAEAGYQASMAMLQKAVEVTSRVRGGWLLHPRGRTHRATVEAWELLRPGRYAALVRLSKGTPTPRGWPDLLGMALRVFDGAGDGRHVDLLMTTTGRAPILRHVLAPRRSTAATYTTILSLRDGRRRRRYLAALPDGEGVFLLAQASPFGRWKPWARLVVGAAVEQLVDFDPNGHLPPGLRAVGFIQRMRARAYPASQRARRRRRT